MFHESLKCEDLIYRISGSLVTSFHPEIPYGRWRVSESEKSNFSYAQGQFRTIAESDSFQAARQGEPTGLRVSQIKVLRGYIPW